MTSETSDFPRGQLLQVLPHCDLHLLRALWTLNHAIRNNIYKPCFGDPLLQKLEIVYELILFLKKFSWAHEQLLGKYILLNDLHFQALLRKYLERS